MAVRSELDRIADELYALHPDAFAGARDEHVKQARASGEKELARGLAALRRPTMSAWLVNLLWRDQGPVVEQLIELADAMAHAQAQASGPALRTLMAQRREIEAALLRRASALAEAAGVKVSPAMAREAQDTLAAAMARPDVAAELRTGRLVKPASYAGFGALAVMAASPASGAPAPPRVDELAARRAAGSEAPAESAPAAGTAEQPEAGRATEAEQAAEAARRAEVERAAEAERAARAERRARAEAREREARAALEGAAAALAEQSRAAEAARDHHQQLLGLLRSLEQQVAAAATAAGAADERRAEAERAHEAARLAAERAAAELAE